MSAAPLDRLPNAFGNIVGRLRQERKRSVDEIAVASGISPVEIRYIEAGKYAPNLSELFRLAAALGESPIILLVQTINAWRTDPTDYRLYKSRPSDMVRLHRLGYFHDPGDFRELPRAYGTMGEATSAARTLSTARRKRGLIPLDTVLIYSRLNYVIFEPDKGEQS